MYSAVVAIHILACLALILIVLLQTGKGAEIGAAFGGASQTLFGGSGGGTFFGKLTTGAAIVFMLTCLGLTYLSGGPPTKSIMENVPVEVPQPGPALPEARPVQPSASQPEPAESTPQAAADADKAALGKPTDTTTTTEQQAPAADTTTTTKQQAPAAPDSPAESAPAAGGSGQQTNSASPPKP